MTNHNAMTGPEPWSPDDLSDEEYAAWEAEQEALYLAAPDREFWDEAFEMGNAGLSPFSDDPKRRLEIISWKIKNGRSLSISDLEFVAHGIDRHLADPKASPWEIGGGKRGRQNKAGIDPYRWELAAEVFFYRHLLPDFDGRKPMTQQELADLLGYAGKKDIYELEKLLPSGGHLFYFCRTTSPMAARIDALIIKEGMIGVTFRNNRLVRQ